MNSGQESVQKVAPAFRYLLLSTAILAFTLIVVGISIRVTNSGDFCVGWPTCSGNWIVSPQYSAFIPYLHRVLAALTGLGLITSLAYAWWRYREQLWILGSLSVAFGLMVIQVIMGRLVVTPNSLLPVSIIHFALSLGILGLIIVPLVFLYHPSSSKFPSLNYSTRFSWLVLLNLVALLALFMSGSWLSASGTPAYCQGWPLCAQLLPPGDFFGWLNLAHRAVTFISAILMIFLVFQAWRTQRSRTAILVASTATGVLFFMQALMGNVESAQNYPSYLIGLHAITAVAVWISMLILVTLVGLEAHLTIDDSEKPLSWSERGIKQLLLDYLMLTKPIVVALLLVTTFAGMVVGARSWPSLNLTFWTLLAGFLAAGGSGAINQYIDRQDDQKMQRTAKRPIPSGRLTPGEGLAFGVAATLISFYLMVAKVNFLAAILTLAGIIYYVLLYSILLKKTTVQNIVIGGGAGAIPPLIGWAAATGSLNIPSLFLFAVVFMWTPPHFWALALVRQKDYARAGVPMLPVVRGERETRWQIFIYTIELVALTLIMPLFGLGGGIYLVSAVLLGGLLLYSAWRVYREEGNKVAWKMYRHSSMYLAFLFVALMVDALL